jgi:hypothetical protein
MNILANPIPVNIVHIIAIGKAPINAFPYAIIDPTVIINKPVDTPFLSVEINTANASIEKIKTKSVCGLPVTVLNIE